MELKYDAAAAIQWDFLDPQLIIPGSYFGGSHRAFVSTNESRHRSLHLWARSRNRRVIESIGKNNTQFWTPAQRTENVPCLEYRLSIPWKSILEMNRRCGFEILRKRFVPDIKVRHLSMTLTSDEKGYFNWKRSSMPLILWRRLANSNSQFVKISGVAKLRLF